MKAFTNRLIASFGVFLLTLAFAGQTHATFPGKNGRIAFTGASGDVFTMNPDGTDADVKETLCELRRESVRYCLSQP